VNEHILLIEDEQALRSTLSVRLRSEGYVVDTAGDGVEGFEKATTRPFDLIILDIMLLIAADWTSVAIFDRQGWRLQFCF